ncbi:DedA family protein [Mesorhizobium sp. VNQ89]|uniref:DedA family protein n=1 Tax=Mesorhizobium quangtriensis TaxID=3157709 RepID=UPI0032B727D5
MSETIHSLIEQYGLIAVFIGCVAEGETAAILAGFFSHQGVFVPWQAFVAVFLGAFGGDAAFFLAGRRFADRPFVTRLRQRPGFDRAFDMLHSHPALYVIGNRYAYGFRLVGGVAAGLSTIPVMTFIVLNAISAVIWTILFGGIGYVFGLGAEQILGDELHKHQRLLVALGIGLVIGLAGWFAAHHLSRRTQKTDKHREG